MRYTVYPAHSERIRDETFINGVQLSQERFCMRKIILDTNFLLIPGRFGLDIFDELGRIVDFPYETSVLEGTIRELQGIEASKTQKGADKRAAKLALSLIKAKDLTIIESPPDEDVDTCILNHAVKDSAVVATQDGGLKRRLEIQNIPRIVLRQKNHLEVIGWIR